MNGTLNLTRASVNTDLTASYNMDDEGIKLLSESRRGVQAHRDRLPRVLSHRNSNHARTSGAASHARDPSQHPRASGEGELHYNCSARDVVVLGALGAGAGGVVKKAVHVPTHRFIALKSMTVFEREKRAALIAEMKLLCEQQGGGANGGDESSPAGQRGAVYRRVLLARDELDQHRVGVRGGWFVGIFGQEGWGRAAGRPG